MSDKIKAVIIALCIAGGIIAAILLTGCTSTYVRTATFTAYRLSVLQKVAFRVVSNADGITVDYGNDGGAKGVTAVAKVGAAMLIK